MLLVMVNHPIHWLHPCISATETLHALLSLYLVSSIDKTAELCTAVCNLELEWQKKKIFWPKNLDMQGHNNRLQSWPMPHCKQQCKQYGTGPRENKSLYCRCTFIQTFANILYFSLQHSVESHCFFVFFGGGCNSNEQLNSLKIYHFRGAFMLAVKYKTMWVWRGKEDGPHEWMSKSLKSIQTES